MEEENRLSVILGAQWGDEGKGKIVDMLAADMDYVCRCQGGSNAGHTVVVSGKFYFFHLLPSCLVNPKCCAVIGNGVVVHLETLFKELELLKQNGLDITNRLFISDRCHIVFDFHQMVDGLIDSKRGKNSIGTTRRGIGPAYSSKMLRNGVRICDLMGDFSNFEKKLINLYQFHKNTFSELDVNIEDEINKYKTYASILRPYVCDTFQLIHDIIGKGKRILVEGANGCLLDIDFGTYPYVTASNTGIGGVSSGLGVSPRQIGDVNIVVKAYTTRVGDGPFPTEQNNEIGEYLRTVGKEVGTSTGRPRRCGWLDLVVIKNCIRLNGATEISLTKVDVLNDLDKIKVAVSYTDEDGNLTEYYPADQEKLNDYKVNYVTVDGWKCDISNCKKFSDLPLTCQNYINLISEKLNVKVSYIGIGPGRRDIIRK